MAAWWESLSVLQRVFAFAAIPSTVVLFLQTILLVIGLAGHGADGHDGHDGGHSDSHDLHHGDGHDSGEHDHDHDHDDHDYHDAGLRIFTLRGLIAFFSIFGWTGLVCAASGAPAGATIAVATIAGFAAMIVIAWILKSMLKLQSNGATDLVNAVGKTGTVYMRVPPSRNEKGKINVLVQEQLIEADAVTDDEAEIPFGKEVVVLGITTPGTLLVSKK